MSFNRNNVPASFRMLRQDLLKKAIEIGNSLLDAGYNKEVAEVIAFSNAKIWPCYLSSSEGISFDRKTNVHLIPHPEGWALIPGDASGFYFICTSKNDALSKARIHAKNEKLKLYIHSLEGNISDSESFAVNRPRTEGQKAPAVKSASYFIQEKVTEKPSVLAETKREAVKRASWLGRKIKNNFWIEKEDGQLGGSFSI